MKVALGLGINLFAVKAAILKLEQTIAKARWVLSYFLSVFKRVTQIAVVLLLFLPLFQTYPSQGKTGHPLCI